MIGVSSSTVPLDHRSVLPLALSVPSICSNSAERFPWISMTSLAPSQAPPRRARPPASSAAISPSRRSTGLRPRGLAELLQRAVADLLAPVRQMRRVQALAAQQLADLARPGARVRLGQDLQLVLRRERTGAWPARPARGPAPPPARRARRPRTPARLRRAGLRGRRQQPQPLPQLHSCSTPTCPAFSVLALKVH